MDQEKLRQELTRDEGKRLLAYRDTNGFWTIGVGHLLGDSPRMSSITEDECTALLDFDISLAEQACLRVFGQPFLILDDVRKRALVNMAFNRGEGRMKSSTTITPAIKAALADTGPWMAVGEAIIASPWAKQIGVRANRLSKMLILGEV